MAVLDLLGMTDYLDSVLQKTLPALQNPKGRGNTFVTAVDSVGMVNILALTYFIDKTKKSIFKLIHEFSTLCYLSPCPLQPTFSFKKQSTFTQGQVY